MRPWAAFYPDVLPFIDAMNAPQPLVDSHLLRAAQQFCRNTRAWRVVLDPITTRAGVSDYDLELPGASELVRIESASMGGVALTVWRSDPAGTGQYVYTRDGKSLMFNQAPGDGAKVEIDASLTPANSATGVEDYVFDRYGDVIATGALARLQGSADAQLAFLQRCEEICVDGWRGLAATTPRARANWM